MIKPRCVHAPPLVHDFGADVLRCHSPFVPVTVSGRIPEGNICSTIFFFVEERELKTLFSKARLRYYDEFIMQNKIYLFYFIVYKSRDFYSKDFFICSPKSITQSRRRYMMQFKHSLDSSPIWITSIIHDINSKFINQN